MSEPLRDYFLFLAAAGFVAAAILIFMFPCRVVASCVPVSTHWKGAPVSRDTPAGLRLTAEELRTIAEQTEHPPSRAQLLRAADDYERFAATAELIHRSAEIVRGRFAGGAA